MKEAGWLPRPLHLLSGWLAPLTAVALVTGFCLLLLARDPHFFWNDDSQVYHLPGHSEMARAWESGEPPLLSPSSWFGGAMAGEYQYGVFSLFTQLVVVLIWKLNLTLPATAALFSLIHLGVLAAGTFFLARQRGLTNDLATLAALATSLNGWIISWAATTWIPALTSFAWVPWAWWALERALERRRGPTRFLPAGFFIYLILTAGWPFTVMMTGVITLFVALRPGLERCRPAVLWPLLAAWAWGGALAAPALLMVVEHLQSGLRAGNQGGLEWHWVVPPSAIIGLIAPYYTCEWLGWEGRFARPAVELACGLVPPFLLAAAVLRLRRTFLHTFRWDLLALGLALLLAMSPSIAPLRYSYRWLPLFHLLLGLVGAQALSSLRADDALQPAARTAASRLSSFDVVAAVLGFLILEKAASLLFYGLFAYLDLGFQGIFVIIFLLVALPFWIWLRKIAASMVFLNRWLPSIVVLVSLWSTYSQVPTRWVKRWEFPETLSQAAPLDPDIRYLSFYSKEEAYRTDPGLSQLIRPGNTAMLSGVQLLNGYSGFTPAGLAQVLEMRSLLGSYSQPRARRILDQEADRQGLLELMGVDGLVLSDSFRDSAPALLEKGWETVFSSEKGIVLHRSGRPSERVRSIRTAELVASPEDIPERILKRSSAPVPRLLVGSGPSPPERVVEYSPCRLETIGSSRLRLEVRVESLSSERGSLIVFARPWYPGYRASLDGRPLQVEALNLILPAVELPAGAEGLLILEYSPATLRIGLGFSALALLLGAGIVTARRRRSG